MVNWTLTRRTSGEAPFLSCTALTMAIASISTDALRAICNEVEALVKKCGKPKMIDAIKLPPPELYKHVEHLSNQLSSLYLLDLVLLVYSPNENQSSASDAIIGVLKRHNQNIDIIFLLLDSKSAQSLDFPQPAGDKESKVDTTRVLKLVPEWSKSVQDWNNLIGPLIDKMFADPSNAAIVKFFSYISEDLKNVVDLVHHVLLHVREQKEIDESFLSRWECRTYTSDEYEEMQRTLFEHLCPLLIIKMLPMKTFDALNSPVMHGHLSQNKMHGSGSSCPELDYECIFAFLLDKALREFQFEDVRKLSAELCGRIFPQASKSLPSELISLVYAYYVIRNSLNTLPLHQALNIDLN
ncbi:putative polyribonucleotide nucleotidyltransferase 1, chloroplastic [Trifolium repens]|nr:putative polyribonucleotide nucleotidyltransferase 1, chloroplastic [Trifolium repens]